MTLLPYPITVSASSQNAKICNILMRAKCDLRVVVRFDGPILIRHLSIITTVVMCLLMQQSSLFRTTSFSGCRGLFGDPCHTAGHVSERGKRLHLSSKNRWPEHQRRQGSGQSAMSVRKVGTGGSDTVLVLFTGMFSMFCYILFFRWQRR